MASHVHIIYEHYVYATQYRFFKEFFLFKKPFLKVYDLVCV